MDFLNEVDMTSVLDSEDWTTGVVAFSVGFIATVWEKKNHSGASYFATVRNYPLLVTATTNKNFVFSVCIYSQGCWFTDLKNKLSQSKFTKFFGYCLCPASNSLQWPRARENGSQYLGGIKTLPCIHQKDSVQLFQYLVLVLHYISGTELLLWNSSIQGTPPVRGHKIWSQKNVHLFL